MYKKLEAEVDRNNFCLETGKMAKQASGSVLCSFEDTKVLVTATVGEDGDKPYFPLRVDYEEKFYAGGKIPGGFFKREGRPSDRAVLNARMIDRPIRPLFPDDYMNELHIVVTVLSASEDAAPEIAGMLGASTALMLSEAPFLRPIAGVHLGKVDGEFVANPTAEEKEESEMDITVAGTKEAVTMVEGNMQEVPEEEVVEAVQFAHQRIKKLIDLQLRFLDSLEVDKEPKEKEETEENLQLKDQVEEAFQDEFPRLLEIDEKLARQRELEEIKEEIVAEILEESVDEEGSTGVVEAEEREEAIEDLVEDAYKKLMRRRVIEEGLRIDNRRTDEIRPITCEVGLLNRAHGSSLFTRGETQSLGVATLGTTREDEQIIDGMITEGSKRFMLHYNFPPYSVGEAGYMGSPGRREKGHGHLAEMALKPVLPSEEEWPYIIRVVSEILESNGSSSMATVCSGSLALMDAGVPTDKAVAGIGIGLIEEGDDHAVLTDIMGLEDHMGDMDFKVAGTRDGVTAFQMDVKTSGISWDIMKEAMKKARKARLEVLDKMEATIPEPRQEVSPHAPVMEVLQVDQDKIGTVIGPGGRTIRELTEETGAEIDIDDDGTVKLSGVDREGVEEAKERITQMTKELEAGEKFEGEVVRIEDFGAFVQLPNKAEGLVHISQLAEGYVDTVKDVVEMGDTITVEVLGRDDQGRLDLKRVPEADEDLEIGEKAKGKITKTTDFGAFVETAGGDSGLIHISELSRDYVREVEDVVKKGDRVEVELINIDDRGRYQFRLLSKLDGSSS